MREQDVTSLAAIGACLSAIGAFLVVLVTVLASVRGKRTDVLIECHRRFDALNVDNILLYQEASETGPNDQGLHLRIDAWSQRFWSLQFDEFEWWQRGHVDTETYGYWALSRYRDFHEDKDHAFRCQAIRSGWEEAKKRWAPPFSIYPRSARANFIDFMEGIRTCSSAAGVPPLVKKHRPRRLHSLGIGLS